MTYYHTLAEGKFNSVAIIDRDKRPRNSKACLSFFRVPPSAHFPNRAFFGELRTAHEPLPQFTDLRSVLRMPALKLADYFAKSRDQPLVGEINHLDLSAVAK